MTTDLSNDASSKRMLAIESATDWLSIALLEGGDVVLCVESEGTRQHAAQLMPLIDRGLSQQGWSVADLDRLAVSAGPGSFTSLRIGLATAKGLAFGRDWQAVSVSTLEAMALAAFETDPAGAAGSGESVCLTLLDARRGEWYGGAWRRGAEGRLESVLAEGLYSPAHLVADLGCAAVVVAPEPDAARSVFESAGLAVAGVVDAVTARPRADWVGRVGAASLERGEGQPPSELAARYLRRAEAEAKRLGGPVERGELARVDGKAS